jgi:predicted Zn-dependent protease
VIEPLLEAERAMAVGRLDQAERLFRQVESADPRNAIAIVGLARVALERGDQRTTYLEARRALALDPDNPAASHLAMRMAELLRGRGEPVPGEPLPEAGATATSAGARAADSDEAAASARPGLVGRFLRRRR